MLHGTPVIEEAIDQACLQVCAAVLVLIFRDMKGDQKLSTVSAVVKYTQGLVFVCLCELSESAVSYHSAKNDSAIVVALHGSLSLRYHTKQSVESPLLHLDSWFKQKQKETSGQK